MDEWWKAILTFVLGGAVGFLLCLLFRRGVSNGTGERVSDVGEQLDKVVDGIAGAEERAKESVELTNRVDDAVDTVTGTSDRIKESIGEVKESVGRISELVRKERERISQSEAEE